MRNCTRTNYKELYLFVFLLLLTVANCILFNEFGYATSRIFTLFIVLISCFLNTEHLLCLIVFCFPFSPVLKISADAITILPLLYAIFALKMLVSKSFSIDLKTFQGFFLLLFLQLVNIVLYGAAIFGVIAFLLNVFMVLLCAIYFERRERDDNVLLKKMIFLFSFSVILSVVMCELLPQMPYMINSKKQILLEASNRMGGLLVEPNELSQMILMAIGFLVLAFSLADKNITKLAIVIAVAYLAITGVRTYSKSYVLALLFMSVILLLLYLFAVAKKKGVGTSILRLVPVALVGLLLSKYLINDVIIPVFEYRAEGNSDLLTGRDYIWGQYWSSIQQRPDVLIAGTGAGNVTFMNRFNSLDADRVPHNTYLEYLIQFGVLGLTAFFGALKRSVHRIKLNKNMYLFLPLSAFLITAFGISANANDSIFILLIFLSIPVYEAKKAEEQLVSVGVEAR